MKVLRNLDLNNVIFIDIETVPLVPVLEEGTPLYDSWEFKVRHNRDNEKFEGDLNESFQKSAALYPEFAKVVCITIGKIKDDVLKLKSYVDTDELVLLTSFANALQGMSAANKYLCLAGHAIKGFDIPFLMCRCLVNQIELPDLLDVGHLKPWEVTAIDTKELWRAGAYRASSLINICTALGIVSPKDEMEGQETREYYYNVPNGLDLIRKYCEKDVLTVANVVRSCRYEPLITADNTEIKLEKVGLVQKVFNTKTTKDKNALVKQIEILPMAEQVAGKLILKTVTDAK